VSKDRILWETSLVLNRDTLGSREGRLLHPLLDSNGAAMFRTAGLSIHDAPGNVTYSPADFWGTPEKGKEQRTKLSRKIE